MPNIVKILLVVLVVAGGILWWQNSSNKNTEPTITILSPNGGETIKEGSTYNITWKTENVPSSNKVAISIRRVAPPPLPEEGQEFDPVIFVNLDNTGSKEWQVSDMYPEGNYLIGINTYASLPVTDPIADESDNTFRIEK